MEYMPTYILKINGHIMLSFNEKLTIQGLDIIELSFDTCDKLILSMYIKDLPAIPFKQSYKDRNDVTVMIYNHGEPTTVTGKLYLTQYDIIGLADGVRCRLSKYKEEVYDR